MAALRLDDVPDFGQLMADAGWTVRTSDRESLLVDPDPSDGVALEIHHGSADVWRDARARVLGVRG